MAIRLDKATALDRSTLWPLFVLLLFVITAPTASVLWFMMRAMTNERAVVRQRLLETYESQLSDLQPAVNRFWHGKLSGLSESAAKQPGQRFVDLVTSGACDSAIICREDGTVLYPSTDDMVEVEIPVQPMEWRQAEESEFGRQDLANAARAFASLATQHTNINIAAMAMQAHIRCLMKDGKTMEAAQILTGELSKPKYHHARNHSGRLVVPNVQLLLLQAANSRTNEIYQMILPAVVGRAKGYADPALLSSQRLFIMDELRLLEPELTFPTSRAEHLADEYLNSNSDPLAPTVLEAAIPGSIWHMATSNRTVIALYTHDTIVAEMAELISRKSALSGATVLIEPATTDRESRPFVTAEACRYMPGWELRVYLEGEDPFAAAANRQVATYIWTAGLTVLSVFFLAIVIGRRVLMQVKLTRMRNDFLATISHELKTPLAASRLLVDTLLDGKLHDQQQQAEYLALIAKENERLSRLIQSFLTYSRMERNKQAFDIQEVEPASIIQAAVESIRDLREADGFEFALDYPSELPTIMADKDAMITVVLNLLDNACKYSGDAGSIGVKAYVSDHTLSMEVRDGGPGMSLHDAKRVFDRFYQADHTLARRAGGCGLGLSIVKFIVAAHHGTIDLNTQLGKGSTFTVRVPI